MHTAMKKILKLTLKSLAIAASVMVLCAVLLMNCKKEPAVSNCDIIGVSWDHRGISVTDPETSCNCVFSNEVRNEIGQLQSLNFSLTCPKSSYSGRVFNITYSLGDIISYDASINGESCHWQR